MSRFPRATYLAVALALVACAPTVQDEPQEHAAAGDAEAGGEAHGAADWGYDGPTGPEHWGDLSPDFAACKTGREQSPIDISQPTEADLPDLVFDYAPTPPVVVNNGHTIEFELPAGTVTSDGTTYNLAQFHFHAPSEHALEGELFPMEVHLVHAAADGTLAVVGIKIEEGAENGALAPFWQQLPEAAGDEIHYEVAFEVDLLLPADRTYKRYAGSLTTPPCTEGVRWHVLEERITMSAEQIAAFDRTIGVSNRPKQPLNERVVEIDVS